MNQIENRVEGIIEPDLLDWDSGDLDEDEFIDFLQTFLEEELEDQIDDPVESNYAEGNIISADEWCVIVANGTYTL